MWRRGGGWRILETLVGEEECEDLEGMLRGLSVELVYEVIVVSVGYLLQ